MPRPHRRPAGFNLAFLDIMACGLGAIILVFMLVKYQTEEPEVEVRALRAQLAAIEDEIRAIEAGSGVLAAQIEDLKQRLREQMARSVRLQEQGGAAAEEIIELAKEIARLEQQKAREQQRLETEKNIPESPGPKTHEQHLIGLRVSGPRILILLDNSASMADERLVDIIKLKAAGAAAQKAAPKWRRALAVADWIIERVPDDSTYMVVRYNDKAGFLPEKKWLRGGHDGDRAAVSGALAELHPHNATNLHAALELVRTAAVRPTDIYVITDSLPTKGLGSLSVLKRIKGCGALASRAATVSGECRLALFYAAIQPFSKRVAAKVNIVLLPVEGDPDAAYAYWLWAATTTGTMISPAGSWP